MSIHRRRAVLLGLVLGAGFGAWDLIATRAAPLAEDTPAALLSFYGPMFAVWGLAGLTAARQTGRLRDAMTVGAVVAFVTFVVFDLAVVLRVNLFLDSLRQRADWQNLVRRYPESGFRSFRAYANFTYAVGAPFKLLVASVIGLSPTRLLPNESLQLTKARSVPHRRHRSRSRLRS